MNTVEIFTGAGGLAIGLDQAGMTHHALIEWNHAACETLRENQKRDFRNAKYWPIFQCDIRTFDYQSITRNIDIVAGGVPCQPFSIGGKHRAQNDIRDMFPEAIRAIRELRPKAFLFENVRGLLRRNFAKYFNHIQLSLSYPEITPKPNEDWIDHLSRLERHHTGHGDHGLHYRVVYRLINAADYGVPQKRERVFIVGIRGDLNVEWCFPRPSHSSDGLLREKFITGEYWDRHRVAKRHRPAPDAATRPKLVQLQLLPFHGQPWRTVRDAMQDLPPSAARRGDKEPYASHFQIPGARKYIGHTGSDPDDPAKTLKAGDHGVPGGENMLALPDGKARYFTIRESARLQAFPDDFIFPGSWTESMRQIGNAVPVSLAETMGIQLKKLLSKT